MANAFFRRPNLGHLPALPLPVVLSGAAVVLSALALVLSLYPQLRPNLTPPAVLAAPVQGAAPAPASLPPLAFSSTLVADVAEGVAPSVVNIDVAVLKQQAPNPFGRLLPELFGVPEQSPTYTQKGLGTGVVFNAEGYIMTNNHVVNGATEMVVTLNDKTQHKAKLVGTDPLTDLAVIKISPPKAGLKPASLGDSATLRPGEWVLAVGSPLGFDHTVTLGIISALRRQVPDLSTDVSYIQTDAAINPGNSGGPLVNLRGQVVGINTAISGQAQNIGFAIPANTVRTIVSDLIANGSVKRAYMGVSLAEMTPSLAQSLGLAPETQGAVVASVSPNSPAERAGLQQGDVVQRIEGKLIKSSKEGQEAVRSKPIGSVLHLQVLRGGRMLALEARTEALTPDKLAAPQP